MNVRILAAALLVLSACTPAAVEQPPAAPEELIVSEGLSTLVLDPKTGRILRTLLEGVLSPTKDALISLGTSHQLCQAPVTTGPCTVALANDLAGNRLGVWSLGAAYVMPATYGPAPSGFSPNGKWLVLARRDAAHSTFAILDLSSTDGRWEQVVLSSRFSFDAIHDDGRALYLIEHPVAGSTAYNVRLYEVGSKRLVPEAIFDKAQLSTFDPAAGLMDGAFHASVAPAGGQWSYGLYVKGDGKPFVHALNVAGRYATCIVDLPGTRTGSSMLAMALAPGARRLFVTDTGGGAVTEIDTETQKVRRSGSFAGRGGIGDNARAMAAVSPDGSRLFATAARGIAVLGTTDLALRGWIAPDLAVRAIAISRNGSRLYALAGGVVHVLEAPSGLPLAEFALPASARAVTTIAVR